MVTAGEMEGGACVDPAKARGGESMDRPGQGSLFLGTPGLGQQGALPRPQAGRVTPCPPPRPPGRLLVPGAQGAGPAQLWTCCPHTTSQALSGVGSGDQGTARGSKSTQGPRGTGWAGPSLAGPHAHMGLLCNPPASSRAYVGSLSCSGGQMPPPPAGGASGPGRCRLRGHTWARGGPGSASRPHAQGRPLSATIKEKPSVAARAARPAAPGTKGEDLFVLTRVPPPHELREY